MQDNKNFIAAMVLSVLVLLGWQYFFAAPEIEQTRQQQAEQTAETPQPATPDNAEAVPGSDRTLGVPQPSGAAATTTAPTDAGSAGPSTARVPINTRRLSGSVDLRGARLDDLKLKDYRETVEPDSPNIVLLAPSTGTTGYFAEFGWGSPSVPTPGPDTVWQAEDGATLTNTSPITLTWDNGAGLTFSRKIAVDDEYMFQVTDTVTNTGAGEATVQPYGRVVRIGEPQTAGFTTILHEGPIGVFGEAAEYKDHSYGNVADDKVISEPSADRGWLGFTDKYWATALVPEAGKTFASGFRHIDRNGTPAYQAQYQGEPIVIAGGASQSYSTRLFAGAKVVSVLDDYVASLGIAKFNLLIDWGYFWFFTQPLFHALDWFFHLFGNFGLAILVVTVIIKLFFFPLANKSYKSMSAMKKLQPKMIELRERYKDDKVKQQQAMMEMYKTEKVNPVAGCWPVALQIPVFFALYKVLLITIEMRHAPFFGWIQDLSAPDPTTIFNLFGLISFTPPEFLMLGIWPLVMGITMWLQMRLNPTPPDPTQAMIFNWMPVVFTFMLARFPAGLVIYWTWNNTLSILQQTLIMHRQGVKIELWDNVRSAFKRKPKDAKGSAKS